MSVCCVYLDVSELLDEKNFSLAYDKITLPERKDKINRLTSLKDKTLSLGAGILTEFMFNTYSIYNYTIEYNANGKPLVQTKDGKKFCFNLSHSGNFIVIACANTHVGVDVEQNREVKDGLLQRVFTQREANYLLSKDKQEAIKLWVRKESYIKYKGGNLFELKNFEAIIPSSIFDEVNFFEWEDGDYRFAVCHGKEECTTVKKVNLKDVFKII